MKNARTYSFPAYQNLADCIVRHYARRFYRRGVWCRQDRCCFGLIVSNGLLALNSYTKNYDLGELGQKHKQAANDLWLIRENYLSLLV
jgi:hypothetical protein